MFGKRCNKYFITTSWNNDQNAESLGKLVTEQGVKNAYLMAPNYQAGKDNMNGVRRAFKGKIIGQSLFKIGARDYQAEITKVRASGAESVIIFAPGPMGIAFLKQWAASGLGKTVKLYTIFTVDWLSLPIIGKEAVGTFHTNYWNVDLDNDANKKMVKDYVAKYGKNPSHFVAQAYDGATLLAYALKANGGKFGDKLKLMKAMRTVAYPSVRGPYKYNVNGAPIQNFYRREVVLQDGKPFIKTTGIVYKDYKDSYYNQCPKKNQM
jgi:branched-chain amino acid transport system substrate-binding protein